MIVVALGLMMDAVKERPYHATYALERPQRRLSLRIEMLRRGHATIRRKSYRVVKMHRRLERAPEPPQGPSPLRAA